jgi:hypothetical protein
MRKNRNCGVVVNVFQDTEDPKKPDSVFPNNWFSTHHDGIVVLYPMLAATRRIERRNDLIQFLKDKKKVLKIILFSQVKLEPTHIMQITLWFV